MHNNKRTPQIRFAGFTDDWEQRKLGEVVEIIMGQSPNSENYTTNPNDFILVQGNADIKNGFVFPRVWTTEITKKASKGSLIFSVRAPVGDIAKTAYDIVLGRGVAAIKGNEFIYQTLSKMKNNGFWDKLSSGSTFESVNSNDIKNAEIHIPNEEEQTAIGNFFKQLDETIALHQRACEKYKNLKKSYLEKLFPKENEQFPELRFPEFTDAWEQRKLGDLGISTGGTSLESEFSDNGIYKVISIGSYSENSTYTDQNIRANLTEKTSKRILNKNDLTMILNDKTASGNIIGRVLLIDADDCYVYNQRTQRIEPYLDMFDPQFIYQLLNAEHIRKKIYKASQGNTQIYVNWSNIKELIYLVPKSKQEQTAIGNFFKQLDETIALHQRKAEKFKQIKQFYLEKMFV